MAVYITFTESSIATEALDSLSSSGSYSSFACSGCSSAGSSSVAVAAACMRPSSCFDCHFLLQLASCPGYSYAAGRTTASASSSWLAGIASAVAAC